ncbi:Cell wall-active antibiotics response 4TMS YvqF [Amycolatopsis arida]|uniref:Cell wall-active antibiotics response 4TMS YvqF n=1 Tax=Amycolatopsis arida TaxID=587909 RepID=A0A1I5WSM8_9PSEU|nr:DUF1707 domain-containing protein [Amycolatopsis arida]TDX92420.1 cell wall-active antibiotic response 4TMS protein YvqF [Amycolatopsis arida]SFQ22487.1 Cell wall-active antibiotics response 4TMS YvqF [Amycolatopsis arida]
MTDLPDRKQLRASDADREHVARILHQAMGEGRITLAELEERLDAVYSAKTLGELEPVTADLPDAGVPGLAVQPTPSRQPAAPDSRVGGTPGSTTSIAVMSGADRKGVWVVPPQHTSFAFWGGVEIDLRHARFAERTSTITAVAIMGGVDIVVPDDIIVEVNGVGFMGAFESRDKARGKQLRQPGPDAPVVKVNGLAFWGAVTVIRKPAPERRGLPPAT